MRKVIVRFVVIGGIVAHHCFDFLFIIYTYIYYDMKKITTNEAFNIQIANFNTSLLANRLLTTNFYLSYLCFSPCCESICMFELMRIFSGFLMLIFYYVY